MIYKFGDFELDIDRFELRQDGMVRPVEPQVFALLELLIASRERMVSKDEINLRVWGGRVVSESVLSSRIRSARRAIGDDGKAQRLIRTLHNRGYRFVGEPVTEIGDARSLAAEARDAADGDADGADAGKPSIAVLPFEMLSQDPRYAGLADAVSHDLIVELSRLRWLFVIARGSSFRFRGPVLDLCAIAQTLGVRYCLTGSLAIHGKTSIVTVELCHAAGGRVIWADRFEGPLDDVLTLRTAIAARVVTAIELRIPMEEAERAAARSTANLDAWSAYHRGLWHMFRFNRHDNEIAARMFDRAITADAGFARAHAGLSFTHFQNAFIGYAREAEAERRLAREHAERSLELDPLDPFANLSMGRATLLAGDLEGCNTWFDRSVELSPNYAFAIYTRAMADAVSGHGLESERGAAQAMALSPLDPLRYAMLATRALSRLVRGEPDEASLWAERAVAAPNAHVQVRVIAALCHELAGNRAAAEAWAAEIRRSTPGFRAAQFFQAFPFRDEATLAQAQAALRRLGVPG